jgi:hypothetical protein
MIEEFLNIFMSGDNLILTLIFYTIVIALYSIFVYYFYRFLARRDIIRLNLNQYNNYRNEGVVKFFAGLFYVIEYIILLPIVTFMWFGFLAVLLLVLSSELDIYTVLLISAALVSAVRITSYIREDLSRDLAKMLPFSLVSIAITSGVAFFSAESLTARIGEIPGLVGSLPHYLVFIVGVELIMRIVGFLFSAMGIAKRIKEESTVMEQSTDAIQ